MTTEFVYSLSSSDYPNAMMKDAVRSIMTLKKWVDPQKIRVYYTPPRNSEDKESLERLGVNVEEVENVTEPFSLNLLTSGKPYGEMWHLTKSDADNVVWLDNDTVVTRNIWDIIEGDFDFRARPEEDKRGDDEWDEMFERHGMEPMRWRFNAGFLVFRGGLHTEVKDRWKRLMDSDLGYYGADLMKDAHSLALCVADREIEWFGKEEHVMEWEDEPYPNAYVYHYMTEQDPVSELKGAMHRRIPGKVKRYLRKRRERRGR